MPTQDRNKLKALADGVFDWMADHPLSSHDALCEGADKGVNRLLDNNAEEFLDQLATMIAAKVKEGVPDDALPAAPEPLTKSQKRRLIRALETAYELAYRRGFHHGFVVRDENPKITERHIAEWRSSSVSERCSPPPGSGGWQPSIVSRMLSESREHGEVIQDFIRAEPSLDIED